MEAAEKRRIYDEKNGNEKEEWGKGKDDGEFVMLHDGRSSEIEMNEEGKCNGKAKELHMEKHSLLQQSKARK